MEALSRKQRSFDAAPRSQARVNPLRPRALREKLHTAGGHAARDPNCSQRRLVRGYESDADQKRDLLQEKIGQAQSAW